MKPIVLLVLATLTLMLASCSANLVSTHVSTAPGRVPTVGVYYTLPRTVVQVSLPVTLTETTEGELADFAPLFLPDDPVLTASRKLSFKPAAFTTSGEPDPELVFHLRGNGGGTVRQALGFEFTEEGVVTGLKAEVESMTADVALAAVGAATGIFSRTLYGSGQVGPGLAGNVAFVCDDPITEQNWKEHFKACFISGGAARQRSLPFSRQTLFERHIATPA